CAERQNVTSRLNAFVCCRRRRAEGSNQRIALRTLLREGRTRRRMLCSEIPSKTQSICFDRIRFNSGKAGCIWLAFGGDQMNPCMKRGTQVILDIASFNGAHGDSSRSVACLKDTRLERSMEC